MWKNTGINIPYKKNNSTSHNIDNVTIWEFPQYKPQEMTDEEFNQLVWQEKQYYEPYYNRTTNEYTQDYNNQLAHYNRLINYTDSDTVKQLSNSNKTFWRIMNRLTNNSLSRWIIGSWIQRENANEWVTDLNKQKQNILDYQRRKETWINEAKSNLATKYQRWIRDINENQTYRAYMDAVKSMQSKQDEYNRNFFNDVKSANIYNPTTPTTQTTPYNANDVNRKNVKWKTKRNDSSYGSWNILPWYITWNYN